MSAERIEWSAERNDFGNLVLTRTGTFPGTSQSFALTSLDEIDSLRLALLEADRLFAEAKDSPRPLNNTVAREGCDFCYCGCKYWENDRCIDCGTLVTDIPENVRDRS